MEMKQRQERAQEVARVYTPGSRTRHVGVSLRKEGGPLTGAEHDTIAARILGAAPLALALALPALVAGLAAPPPDLLLPCLCSSGSRAGSAVGRERDAAQPATREVSELIPALVLVLIRERERVVALPIDRGHRRRERIPVGRAILPLL